MSTRPTHSERTPEEQRMDYRWGLFGILFLGMLGVGLLQFDTLIGSILLGVALIAGVGLAIQETQFKITDINGKGTHTSGASAMRALLEEIELRTVIRGQRLGFVTVTPERSLTRKH